MAGRMSQRGFPGRTTFTQLALAGGQAEQMAGTTQEEQQAAAAVVTSEEVVLLREIRDALTLKR